MTLPVPALPAPDWLNDLLKSRAVRPSTVTTRPDALAETWLLRFPALHLADDAVSFAALHRHFGSQSWRSRRSCSRTVVLGWLPASRVFRLRLRWLLWRWGCKLVVLAYGPGLGPNRAVAQ